MAFTPYGYRARQDQRAAGGGSANTSEPVSLEERIDTYRGTSAEAEARAQALEAAREWSRSEKGQEVIERNARENRDFGERYFGLSVGQAENQERQRLEDQFTELRTNRILRRRAEGATTTALAYAEETTRRQNAIPTAPAAASLPPSKKLSDFLDDDQTEPFDGFDASNYEDRPGGLQETKSAGTFSIQEFRTNITSVSDNILPTHSFLVTFPRMNWINSTLKKMDIERYLTMRCETVIAPVMSFLQENIVRRYGYGPLENVPYGVNSQEFTLQFIVDRNSLIPEFFEQWMNFIINRDSFGGANMLNTQNGRDPYEVQYKDNYVAPMVNIQVYDRKQINVMSYKIYDVFPNNIQSINLNWSDADQLMRLNVSFSFTDFRLITQYKVAEGPPKEKVTLNDGPITIPQETLEQVELPQIGTLYISGDDEQAPGSQDATASSGPGDTPPVSPTPVAYTKNFNGGPAA